MQIQVYSIQYMMYVFIKKKIPKKACLVYKSDLDSFNTSFIHKTFPAYSILRDIIYSINTNSSFLILNFFLFPALGLSCSMWDLHCGVQDLSLQQVGFSLIAAHGLSCPMAYRILVPWPGIDHIPCIGRWILNHWTIREVPQ